MIPVTPEIVDAHRQDLLSSAEDHRRGRGEASAPPRRHFGWWTPQRAH